MKNNQCVLAVYPMIRGFAFVLFASPSNPIDWGIQYIVVNSSKRNAASLSHIESLVARYQPDAIVIEDYTELGSRRSPRIRRLYHSLTHAAQTKRKRSISIESQKPMFRNASLQWAQRPSTKLHRRSRASFQSSHTGYRRNAKPGTRSKPAWDCLRPQRSASFSISTGRCSR